MNENKPTNVVVLGGGYAGTLAALRLAGKTKGKPVTVTLVNGEEHFVERIRHHQLAAGQTVRQHPFAEVLAGSGVHFVQGWCTDLRPAAKELALQTANGNSTLSYDYLIYALGSTIDKTGVPGIVEHAYTLADVATADRLAQVLPKLAANRGRLLIGGGGLTGIEAATELAERYPAAQVTLVTKGKLGAALSAAGATHLRRVFARLGITVIEETTVEQFTANAAHCADGRVLAFDACLWAGAFIVPPLAAQASLPVDRTGRLLVDETLRVVDHAEIYAAGDAAATGLRMACATAMPMGAYVADHLAARLTAQPLPDPFRFAYVIQCISLGRREGLVQFVQPDDSPKPRIITGWAAAGIKELICRFTVWSLSWEKRWPGLYSWLKTQSAVTHRQAANREQVRYGQTTANL
jgi:NADH dehydrogenase FAD-containing subunit